MPLLKRFTVKIRFTSPTVENELHKMGIKPDAHIEGEDPMKIAAGIFNAGMNVQLEHFPTGDIIWVEKCRFIPQTHDLG